MDLNPSAGELVLVATPLGNLGDLSPRAQELLARADAIYCEDTRRSRTLLSAHGIPAGGRLHALHEHNEARESERVRDRVAAGELVVLVSDAGTPGISDPGARAVATVVRAGLRVTTAPGPSAVIAALSVSGLPTERFVMEGFLPRKSGERAEWYRQWEFEERTVVFYESPSGWPGCWESSPSYTPSDRWRSRESSPRFTKRSVAGPCASSLMSCATRYSWAK